MSFEKGTIMPTIDDRGTIMIGYAVLLSVVAVGCSRAVIGLGAPSCGGSWRKKCG